MEKRRPGRPVGRSDIRDKLLAAARERFLSTPYSKVTTREIAERAGSNLAMIHYYFGSKEGLYQAVLGDVAEPLEQAWQDEGSHRSLNDLLSTYYQVMAPNSELTSAISSALSSEKSPGRDFVLNRLLERQMPQFDALLAAMKDNGELNADADPEMLKVSFLSMMWQPFVMKELYEQVFGLKVDEQFMARLANHNCRLMESGLRPSLN
ncbi:TetR/AcrR family transcriptional regulator [Aeromonas rivuli]|jgi:AcrR family transcriptional regulator|uniref:TetR/AcrR family transcriptional regulator n=1 Tax=Aeromonas TaxID=642 RepID=UPI0005AA8FE2|nr:MULTISPECIES: TetR/AcrR family transcriptional regulator [Aeromonas]MCS3457731.1 AcrR family transcriptional regulator [Aeromonas sp. BIGb0405]MCS3461781.1 AcrR family transcriptional regulator [Aeromonas sp. BIGb0445]UBO73373.1 TetR family transcriptional regulator [Aeromonas rivuli]